MNDTAFNSATSRKTTINKISDAQAKIAQAGVKAQVHITNADGTTELVSAHELSTLLTNTTYNSICSAALATINTDLAAAKSTANSSYAAL